MSEENKSNESNIENIKEQGKKVAKELTNKADELYNKLPLDQINEKLGGKVDVKGKKFKIYAALGGIVAIILLLLTMCDREPRHKDHALTDNNREPRLNVHALAEDADAEQNRIESSLAPEERVDFRIAFLGIAVYEAKNIMEKVENDRKLAQKIMGMNDRERNEFMLKDYDGLTAKEFIKKARACLTEDEWNEIKARMALENIMK